MPPAHDHSQAPTSDYRQEVHLDELPPEGIDMLQHYSGIPHSDILAHRDEAYACAPFACIGQVRFLLDRWPALPYTPALLDRLRAGGTFLDAGCALGQQLRYLIARHGVEPDRLFGFDCERALVDAGYALFRDRDRMPHAFFEGDMAAPLESTRLREMVGIVDVLHFAQVLHVLDWDDSRDALVKMVALLRRQKGTMVAMNQMGSSTPGSYPMRRDTAPTGSSYRHDESSIRRLWAEVSEATGTKWDVSFAGIFSKAISESKGAWWAKGDPGMNMFAFWAVMR